VRRPDQLCFSEISLPQGFTAPSSMVSDSSGITSAVSNSTRVPSPLQSTHMPCGLLNENACGVSSGKEMPHGAQAILSEKTRSPASVIAISVPSPRRSACSTESVTRARCAEPATRRSTTTSTWCFLRLSSASVDSLSTIAPSTRSRTKPASRSSASSSRCSPLRFTRIGASSVTRVPAGAARISFAIRSAVWEWTGRPQPWQCWRPTRA